MQFKNEFIKLFGYLYPQEPDYEVVDKYATINKDEEAEFAEQFGWYPMLATYAKEQNTNIEATTKVRASNFLTFLNYYKRKVELDNKRITKIGNKPLI